MSRVLLDIMLQALKLVTTLIILILMTMTVTLSVTLLHLPVTVVTPLPVLTTLLPIPVLRVLPLVSSVPPLLPALALQVEYEMKDLVKLYLLYVDLLTITVSAVTPPLIPLSPTVIPEPVLAPLLNIAMSVPMVILEMVIAARKK